MQFRWPKSESGFLAEGSLTMTYSKDIFLFSSIGANPVPEKKPFVSKMLWVQ